VSEQAQTFEPFANESAYIHLNERMVDRVLRRLGAMPTIRLLDLAAGTGLLTSIAYERAKDAGVRLLSTLLDLDLPALMQARKEVTCDSAAYIFGTADHLPLKQTYDAVIFANSLHLLDEDAKAKALKESWRVLRPGGLLAMNTTFYEGAYPEESKPFYSRWIRRAIVEILLDTKAAGQQIVARVEPSVKTRSHEKIRLTFVPDRIHFFDSKTEQVIK